MITLQFASGNDFAADLIEWFGHGGYSHVDTVWQGNGGQLLGARSDSVGGAMPGVQFRHAGYLDGEKTLRVELQCADDVAQRYYNFLCAQVGKPYDKEGIAGFIAGRDWQDPQAWFCSELVAAGLEAAGYFKWPLATPSNKITPADLLLVLSALVPIKI